MVDVYTKPEVDERIYRAKIEMANDYKFDMDILLDKLYSFLTDQLAINISREEFYSALQ